jgi:hypothetical protein
MPVDSLDGEWLCRRLCSQWKSCKENSNQTENQKSVFASQVNSSGSGAQYSVEGALRGNNAAKTKCKSPRPS